jgi:ribulose-bisphosphate carboxylase large chain
MTGLRKKSGQYNKVLMGAILKPKTGASSKILLEMTKALVEGGVDFIKEDEILGNPNVCKLEDRVELISNYISKTNVVYSFCINSDPAYVLDRVRFVENNGGNGVHINFWSGLGVYKSIRELDTNLYIHMQKSGDKILTHKDNPFSISWQVICKLMTWSGADTIHAGMRYGYLHDPLDELNKTLKILRDGNTVPALSCGLTSEIIPDLVEEIGVDFMANAGGSIHGHPKGTTAGALEIRKAIDKIKV